MGNTESVEGNLMGETLREAIAGAVEMPHAAGPATTFFINRVWAPWGDRLLEIWLQQWTDDFERLAPAWTAHDLSGNPAFCSTSIQIAKIVAAQRHPQKLMYLRNALLRVAMGKDVPSDSKVQIFLNAVEFLSPDHVEVLNVIRQPISDPGKSSSEATNSFVMGLGQGCHDSLVQAVLSELVSRGFLNAVGPGDVFPRSGPYAVTNLGAEFLNFIQRPVGLGVPVA
jgi:hypothetical protein